MLRHYVKDVCRNSSCCLVFIKACCALFNRVYVLLMFVGLLVDLFVQVLEASKEQQNKLLTTLFVNKKLYVYICIY